ncbi:UNVERIFIED_ASMBLY: helicase [Shigella phage 2019SD1]|uniref:Helicase n=1 Tax=Shigella phage 2019SD1 TaxID=2848074 RepID=A0A6M5C9U5_9CAUD|nr:DNA helicase [Shigella phage 2019SD1]
MESSGVRKDPQIDLSRLNFTARKVCKTNGLGMFYGSEKLGRFTVEYHGTDQPTALYVVTSQPPSTGKSAVNSPALAPMVAEVERINDQRKKERKRFRQSWQVLQKRLGRFTVEYHGTDQPTALYVVTSQPPSTGKSAVNSPALAPMVAEVERINDQRKKERKRFRQSWQVLQKRSKTYISAANASGYAGDDAEMGKLIEIITRHGKANKGILNVRAIYEAARKVKPFVGQAGVMKRMETQLLPMLEERNYICVINGVVFVNPTLLGSESNIQLKISKSAMRVLNMARQEMEPHLADGGKYSHTMLRGALGKMDKQVIRIASVLHTIRNWFNRRIPSKVERDLKAWDHGHVSIARANADNNMSFKALGCMAVIARDETINAIMDAGSRGIGVSERYLLVREESFCDIVFPVSDTTPEGLARINNRRGNFAVISDEATSINSLIDDNSFLMRQ